MGTVTYVTPPDRGPAAEFVARLASTYGAQLQRYLMRMLGRADVAEEVAQETYLKLYRLSRPDEVICPQALLFDVATKLAITRLRRARAEETLAASAAEMEALPDDVSRPDRRAAAAEAVEKLTEIMEQLPPSLRQVFVMRYVKHMPRQEIAERLSITVGAVEQRLTRALAQCRARLAALGIDWLGVD